MEAAHLWYIDYYRCYDDARLKRCLAPYDTRVASHFMLSQSYWCLRIAPLRSSSRNSANIRNPLIYYVNRYFLMFGGSQVQKPYHASMNGFLTFWPWHHFTRFFWKFVFLMNRGMAWLSGSLPAGIKNQPPRFTFSHESRRLYVSVCFCIFLSFV